MADSLESQERRFAFALFAPLSSPDQLGWIVAFDNESGTSKDGESSAFELLYLGPHTIATYQGPATVGGISTRQYVLSASTSTATPSTATASQTVATVWIDSSGRLIQYTYSPTGDGTWVTATYSNWGEQVTVQAPPANLVNVLQGAM